MDKLELNNIKDILNNAVDVKPNSYDELEIENQFYNSIKGYVKNGYFENIFSYIDIVLNSNLIHGLIITGEAGIGKSFTIKGYLKEKNIKFKYYNNYTTALSFYKEVYKNKDNVIILDDLTGLFHDAKGINLLKALLNTEDKRIVKYKSTTEKLDIPSSFIFNGKIIILVNEVNVHIINSLKDRVIFREVYIPIKKQLELLDSIISFNYPSLPIEDRNVILEHLNKVVDETTDSFSFRKALRIVEFYINDKDNWIKLADEELSKDENLSIVKSLMNNGRKVKEQVNEFIEQTGYSRRQYFLLKKRLVQKCSSAKMDGDKIKGE